MSRIESSESGPELRLDPRLIAAATLVGPLILQLLLPWTQPEIGAIWVWAVRLLGGLLLLIGLLINVAGIRVLRTAGEDPAPSNGSQELVREGPFRFSRNPMYLGFSLFTLGFGLLLRNLWLISATLIGWVVIDRWVIPAEERYLRRRFGDRFLRYEKSTKRWIYVHGAHEPLRWPTGVSPRTP